MAPKKTELQLAKPLTLPCGLTLPNRLVKAALAESWCDSQHLPSERLIETYGIWADGGWGMVLTGNVQVDATYLGTPFDNALNDRIPREKLLASWRRWAAVTNRHGTPTVMQLNHPGRQSTIGAGQRRFWAKSIAPSAIPLRLGKGIIPWAIGSLVFGTPREMTTAEIDDVVRRFADAARLASEAGFAGVQIHGAHGYLLAQFLSARSNERTDEYGGSARARAKVVVDIVRAIREAVPPGFAIGLKFNSVDHQSEQELAECIEQLQDITAAGLDYLEVSGGTYEDPTMMTGGGSSNEAAAAPKAASTVAREAFFLEFAKAIRQQFSHVPLVVTGGFRTRKGMEAALRDGGCDMIGIGRPAVLNAHLPANTILNGEVADDDAKLYSRSVSSGCLVRMLGMKAIAGGAETAWYQQQMYKMLRSVL